MHIFGWVVNSAVGLNQKRKYWKCILAAMQMYIMGVFGYRLFCWNWKFIAESTVNKSKSKLK